MTGIHPLCGRVHKSQDGVWFCVKVRQYYPEMFSSRKPRRSHDEVVLEKKAKAERIAARKEFNRKKKAERLEKLKAKGGVK